MRRASLTRVDVAAAKVRLPLPHGVLLGTQLVFQAKLNVGVLKLEVARAGQLVIRLPLG